MLIIKPGFMRSQLSAELVCIVLILFMFPRVVNAQLVDSIRTTNPDDLYGKGGKIVKTTLTYGKNEKMVEVEERVYDANKKLRYYKRTLTFSSGALHTDERYYDCNEKRTYAKQTITDSTGKEVSFNEEVYKNDKQTNGVRRFRQDGQPRIQHYKNGEWEDESMDFTDATLPNGNYTPNTTSCEPPFDKNEFYVFATGIVEDSKPSFLTYGGDIEYTRLFNPVFGVTADAGANFGSNSGVDYTKFMFMVGPTYFPVKSADANDKFSFSLHALAGVTALNSDFGPATVHNTNFSMGIGICATQLISKKFGLGVLGEYNPVFGNNRTANNFRFGLGAVVR